MKKKYFMNTIIYTLIGLMIVINLPYDSNALEFDVDAKSAVLLDAGSGKILYEKGSHEKLPPASVTKIMTMLLAMEALDSNQISLQDEVSISENASSMGGSQLYLEPGEKKTVEQLLSGIAIASANDACVALAEHIAGTEDLFVQRMNERAKELGMKDTQFKNTNGLPEEGHYTSAHDISIMSLELLKHPKIHDWLTVWMSTMKVGKGKETTLELTNTNKMIRFYEGANGIKTGFTQEARFCLSASATRNNFTLIAVVLGSPTSNIRFTEARKLLDYGFAAYNSVPICKNSEIIQELKVEKGKLDKVNIIPKVDFSILVKKGEENNITKEIVLPESMKAPIDKNQKVGEIIVKNLKGEKIGKVDLITEKSIERASVIDMYGKVLRSICK